MLTQEYERAALQQKVIFWTNSTAEEIQRETETPPHAVPDLIASDPRGEVWVRVRETIF